MVTFTSTSGCGATVTVYMPMVLIGVLSETWLRETEKPSAVKKNILERQMPAVPDNYIPRGSPARAATRPDLDRDAAP